MSQNSEEGGRPSLIRPTVILIRCILMPLFFHSFAHTVPSTVTHVLIDHLRDVMSYI